MDESKSNTVAPKPKEVKLLNQILMALAALCVLVAAWDIITNQFRGGTDDLFLVLTALMLAALFAMSPLMEMRARAAAEAALDLSMEEPEMEAHAEAHAGTDKQNTIIWGVLLGLTGFEVMLAYIQLNLTLMLIILMGASIIKAALIVAYFMHLKFERLSLILTIVPTLVVLFCLFAILFPDSHRARLLRAPHVVEQVDSGAGEK
jgi:cytochrome c oxidase subunit 4